MFLLSSGACHGLGTFMLNNSHRFRSGGIVYDSVISVFIPLKQNKSTLFYTELHFSRHENPLHCRTEIKKSNIDGTRISEPCWVRCLKGEFVKATCKFVGHICDRCPNRTDSRVKQIKSVPPSMSHHSATNIHVNNGILVNWCWLALGTLFTEVFFFFFS